MSILSRLIKKGRGAKAPDDAQASAGETLESERDDDELRRVEHELIRAGRAQVLVAPASRGVEARLLSHEVADLMRRCDTFATLEEHAATLCDALGLDPDESDLLEDQLRQLVETGLLQRRRDVERSSSADDEGRASIGVLTIPTCDRPGTVPRCIESYLASAQRHGRELKVLLFDDSNRAESNAEYAALVDRLRAERGPCVSRVTVAGRRRFAEALVARGLPPGVVSFAMFGDPQLTWTIGATHNSCMLVLAGEAFASADDDTWCALAPTPHAGQGFELSSAPEPTELWLEDDLASALGSERREDLDVIALHETLLGRSLAACAREPAAQGGLHLEQAGDRLLRVFSEGRGRVAVTSLGLSGDSGMGSSKYFLFTRGGTRERLVEDEARYRDRRVTRWIRRGVRRATITDSHFLMMPCVALDNRQCLPPFFPVQRNHDGVMGFALRKVAPDRYLAHLPWMVAHDPGNPRANSMEANLRAGARWNLDGLVIQSILAWYSPNGVERVEERTQALGRSLEWLGSLEVDAFEEFIVDRLRRAMSRAVDHLETSLATYDGEPEWWADDVRRLIDATVEAMPGREIAVPLDLTEGRSPREALAFAQQLIGRYGEVLSLWPAIRQESAELRREGLSVTEP